MTGNRLFDAAAIRPLGFWRGTFVLSLLLASWSDGWSATFTVPGNYPSISSAVANAPHGSTILVAPGTYVEYIEALNLNKSLYVKTSGAAGSAVISGGGVNRLLRIDNAVDDNERNITFDGFVFANGVAASGLSPVMVTKAKPAFLNCTFQDNISPDKGGAVMVFGPSNTQASFANCIFRRNTSHRYGGAVLVNGGHMKAIFKDCLFEDNTSRTSASSLYNEGGAINFSGAGGTLWHCTFRRNSTIYAGGAIMILNSFAETMDTVKVIGCVFDGNYALAWNGSTAASPPTEGGAIMSEDNAFLEIEGCLFTNNYAQSGGAIQNYRSQTSIRTSVFDNNRAVGTQLLGFGGAVAINSQDSPGPNYPSSIAWINDTLIRNCVAPAGGGIYASGDGSRGTLASDRAQLYMRDVVVENCRLTVSGNSYGNGGGLYLGLAHCVATNLFLIRNVAEGLGGGFVTAYNTFCQLDDSHVVGNDSLLQGDAYYSVDTPAPSFINTTVAYNGGSGTANKSVLAAIPSVSLGGVAYLTWLNMPFGSPSISPRIGALPNCGGYAGGTAVDSGITANTTYSLTSQQGTQQDTVTLSSYGIYNLGFGAAYQTVPGTVEAENFDQGGASVGYRDATLLNEGGSSYRAGESADIVASGAASGGNCLTSLLPGEWMDYTLFVSQGGNYTLNVRVGAPAAGGSFYVQVDGADVTGVLNVPATGGAISWQDITKPMLALGQGFHQVRLVVVTPGFNIDNFRVNPAVPTLAVTPGLINRTTKIGNDAVSQSFTVQNVGGSNLNYAISDSASWLSVNPASGSSGGEADTIQITYNTAGLALGTYTAVITVTAPGAVNSPSNINVTLRVRPNQYVMNDFDGDGTSDLGVYYPPGGNWYIFQSSRGFMINQFGYAGTLPVPGDFDADGKSDLAVYYPPGGNWYIFGSTNRFFTYQFGYAGTLSVAGDFDADGQSDVACYYPPGGNWYAFGSRQGFMVSQFGYAGTMPVAGDYDGDGEYDFAVYDLGSGQWFIYGSTSGFKTLKFGYAGAVPVSGDFDGDGIFDYAVFHAASGTWNIRASTAGQSTAQFGFAGTIPVSGDFDGDGKYDLAVYYPAGGAWYILGSANGFFTAQFGFAGTLPVGGSFVP